MDLLVLDSLKQMKLVPQRESDSLDDRLICSVTVLLDGNEHPINRPKYEQEEYYSEKKEIHDKKQPDNKHECSNFIFKPDIGRKCTRQKNMRQGRSYIFQKTKGFY